MRPIRLVPLHSQLPIWERDTEELPSLQPQVRLPPSAPPSQMQPAQPTVPPPLQTPSQNSTTHGHSQIWLSLRLLGIITVLAIIFSYLLLKSAGLAPSWLTSIATIFQNFITGIVVLSVLFKYILSEEDWEKLKDMTLRMRRILALVSILIFISFTTLSWLHFQPPAPITFCPSKPLTSVTKFSPFFMQRIPNYNNPEGVSWYVNKGTSAIPCVYKDISGFALQQTTDKLYAEMDLLQIGGTSYNQTDFSAQVQLIFINPNESTKPPTLAGLLVQSPEPSTLAGGFDFLVNTSSEWQLKQWREGSAISTYDDVKGGGNAKIDIQRQVTLLVRVQHGKLYGYINGKLVVTYKDDLPKPNETWPRQIALQVERPLTAPSSQVLFSNIEFNSTNP